MYLGAGIALLLLGYLIGYVEYRVRLQWMSAKNNPPRPQTPVLFCYGMYVTKGYIDSAGNWWDMTDHGSPVPTEWVDKWTYLPEV